MKKNLSVVIAILLLVLFSIPAVADDITLQWDPSTGATSYRIYQSLDNGATWAPLAPDLIGTTANLTGIQGSGLVLFRISALWSGGEEIRYWSGAWYNGDFKPVTSPSAAGID